MDVLVVGRGSAAKRHISNLQKLSRVKHVIVYSNHAPDIKIERNSRIETINSLKDISPDFAIIANQTHRHISVALKLADKGIPLFIEKPLSHNTEGLNRLRRISIEKNSRIFVAYNLRFLRALRYIKSIISRSKLGKLYFARIEAGQYLPLWRPLRDYTNCYSARREEGGGVGLDLSHELDYMRYLFGNPIHWQVFSGRISDLKIDSNDIFEGRYHYPNKFICSVHLDYLYMPKRRGLYIIGSRGTLSLDFVQKKISISYGNLTKGIGDRKMFEVNRTYLDELIYFIDMLKANKKVEPTLEDGMEILNLLKNKNA